MTDEASLNHVCKKCGKPLNEDENNEKIYCPICTIDLADKLILEKTKTPKPEQTTRPRVMASLRLVILLTSLFIIAARAHKLVSVIEEQKPIRHGTYSTDRETDKCIKNLWQISSMLQKDMLPYENITCPVSKKPYVITEKEVDIVVICPNPELHGFKEIRVSKIYPCPKVTK